MNECGWHLSATNKCLASAVRHVRHGKPDHQRGPGPWLGRVDARAARTGKPPTSCYGSHHPIYEGDVDRLRREFLRQEFLEHRLGKPGQWQGAAVPRLELKGPVESKAIAHLLQGRTLEGEPLLRPSAPERNRVLGWRASEGPVNALWGLSKGALRGRMQLIHAQAVQRVVVDFENTLNGRPWFNNPDARGRKSVLVAKFQSGASRRQTPRLETNLVLFNVLFEKGRENQTLDSKYVLAQQRRMRSVYAAEMQPVTAPLLTGRHAQALATLARHFERHPPGDATPARRLARAQPLAGRQLFAAWQAQARSWGWHPEQMTGLIHAAGSRPTLTNWLRDARTLGRVWSIWVRQPAHSLQRVRTSLENREPKTHAKVTQSKDHGMSH